MATYAELKAKAEKYAAEAEAQRVKELEAVIADMKAKMVEYGVTPEDLGIKTTSAAPRKKVVDAMAKAAAPKGAVKYRSPTGETWGGGRGRKPKWIVEAVAAGKKIEDFAV